MHGVCGDGMCQNVPGNFQCDCKDGYESSSMMQICVGQYMLYLVNFTYNKFLYYVSSLRYF